MSVKEKTGVILSVIEMEGVVKNFLYFYSFWGAFGKDRKA